MNFQILKGSWDQVKGELKKKYANLTESDLIYLDGQKDVMLGKLEKKLGITRVVLEKTIHELQEKSVIAKK